MKRYLTYIMIITIIILSIYSYYLSYSMSNDITSIETKLSNLMNNEIMVIELKKIDNKLLVYYRMNKFDVGIALLSKGLNGKYTLSLTQNGYNTPYGWGFRPYEKLSYFIIYGYNPQYSINTIQFSSDQKHYKLDISNKEYYLLAYPYENLTDFFPFKSVTLTDRANKDITKDTIGTFRYYKGGRSTYYGSKTILSDYLLMLIVCGGALLIVDRIKKIM